MFYIQWSTGVYDKYIFIFGSDSAGEIFWINVLDNSIGSRPLSNVHRWSGGVALVQSLYGYPTFMHLMGDEVKGGTLEPSGKYA